jgi:hypothetical protein
MPDLGKKTISREGVQDRRARDSFRLTEENFVALFNDAKRDKSWVTERSSVTASNSSSGFLATNSFSIVARPKTTRVEIGLFPAADYLEFTGMTGPISLPVPSLFTIAAITISSAVSINCLRDGQIIGTETFNVTAGQTLYYPVGSIRFLDRAANGVPHTYQLQITQLNTPGVGSCTVTLSNVVWEAREVP